MTTVAARLDVTFPSGDDQCAAWLHLPATTPAPCVVMAPCFGATRHEGFSRFAERFAEAGFAALVFDYRHFGDSGAEPRQLLDLGRQRADYRAAIAYARGREEVDAERIALWGWSLSGGHVITLGSEDPSLAAIVAMMPHVEGRVALRTSPLRLARLILLGLRDRLAAARGRPPVTTPIVGLPGSLALLQTPSCETGYRSVVGEGSPWRDEVAARLILTFFLDRPVTRAAKVTAPLLVQVGHRDDLTPAAYAIPVAERAPRGELRQYDGAGHYDIVAGEWFEPVVADQVEFLTRHLRDGPGGTSAVH